MFWTMIAVGVIIVIEVMRYIGSSYKPDERQNQPVRSRPGSPTVRIELEEDNSLPRENETITLWGSDEEGVWVSLEPASFNEMSIFQHNGQQDDLIAMRNSQHIAQVPNGTRATVLKGSIIGF